jgi:hypothetical protein
VIEQLFPEVVSDIPFALRSDKVEAARALLAFVDQLPEELLPSQTREYNALIIGLHTLQTALDRWESYPTNVLETTPGGYRMNPVQLLYKTLQQCRDEAPSPATTDLLFITDSALRAALRLDISTAYRALGNGEWKPATVMGGSVVEALLLWALQHATASDRQTAITGAMTKGTLSQPPQGPTERWDLAQYIAVAEALTLIDTNTATQARLAKDFRNLIHPGRTLRLAQVCDRGTALAALAAVEMVVRCLTP